MPGLWMIFRTEPETDPSTAPWPVYVVVRHGRDKVPQRPSGGRTCKASKTINRIDSSSEERDAVLVLTSATDSRIGLGERINSKLARGLSTVRRFCPSSRNKCLSPTLPTPPHLHTPQSERTFLHVIHKLHDPLGFNIQGDMIVPGKLSVQ